MATQTSSANMSVILIIGVFHKDVGQSESSTSIAYDTASLQGGQKIRLLIFLQ